MVKNILSILFLLLILSPCYSQDPGPFTAENTIPLLAKLKEAGDDTNKVQLLFQLSDQYYYRKNFQPMDIEQAYFYTKAARALSTSLAYHKGEGISELQLSRILPKKGLQLKGRQAALQAINIFSKYNEFFQLGEAYYTLAGYYPISGKQIATRIQFVEKSREAFEKANNKAKLGQIFQQLGDLYLCKGDIGKGLAALKQSLTFFQMAKFKDLMGLYDLMGLAYAELGSPHEAIQYGLLAVRIAGKYGRENNRDLCTIYNRIGNSYDILHDYEKQRYYQDKALKLAIRFNDVEAIHEVAANLATCLSNLGREKQAISLLNETVKKYPLKTDIDHILIESVYVQTYRKLHQTDMGRKYSEKLERIALKSVLLDSELKLIYSALIPSYLHEKNYVKAEKYLRLSRELAIKSNFGQHLYFNYFWSAKLDSSRGNYLAAFIDYQKFSALKDSIFNAGKIRQMNQLEIIYEVEKKNSNIQFLTKQSALQQGMLVQAEHIQNFTFVSIILLLIITFLLVSGYRLTKKSNQRISAKQEEINRKNISLQRLLNDKEWLIKEIHHRVKNNLHMVAGLLHSQLEFLTNQEARTAISDSHHRIQSMSMIHQKLYHTENLSTIDMSAYVHEMVEYHKDSFKVERDIRFLLDIDRVEMNISHCIPLGLILNEAITNAIKYAFPGQMMGKIFISLKRETGNQFKLTIADNGIGLHDGFDLNSTNSFGLTLIQGLCGDLDGELCVNGQNGTTIEIIFDYESTLIELS